MKSMEVGILRAADVLVQEYPVGHPEHAMSAALHALQPGASVAIKGPFGTFRYQPGKYKAIGAHPPAWQHIHRCLFALEQYCQQGWGNLCVKLEVLYQQFH